MYIRAVHLVAHKPHMVPGSHMAAAAAATILAALGGQWSGSPSLLKILLSASALAGKAWWGWTTRGF